MRRNEKSWAELDEMLEPFLPEESVEAATATAIEFRKRLVKLEQQVLITAGGAVPMSHDPMIDALRTG